MFLAMGLNSPDKKRTKPSKRVIGLGIIPVVSEFVIVTVFTFSVLKLFPSIDFDLTIVNYATVISLLACAAPTIIVPICMKAQRQGIKAPIFDEVAIASLIDSYLLLPISMFLLIVSASFSTQKSINLFLILLIVILIFVSMYISYVLAGYIGRILSNLKIRNNIISSMVLVLVTVILVTLFGPTGSFFGVTIGLGLAKGYSLKSPSIDVSLIVENIYGYIFQVFLFVYVGTQIPLEKLTDIKVVLIFILIVLISISSKALITIFYMKKVGYSKEEAHFVASVFIPKGIILVNMIVIFNPIFLAANLEQLTDFLYILAAVSILLTITLGTILPNIFVKKIKQLEK